MKLFRSPLAVLLFAAALFTVASPPPAQAIRLFRAHHAHPSVNDNGEGLYQHKEWHPLWTCRQWDRTEDYLAGRKPNRTVRRKGNVLLDGGITALSQLLAGTGGTAYNSSNARLYVGDGSTAEAHTQSDLQAAAGSAKTITAASNASPISVTATAHGFCTGQLVTVAAVGGNTAANATWIVTVVDANTFTLNGSTGNGAYTSGGTATPKNIAEIGMDATFPSVSGAVTTWKGTYGSTQANWHWQEVGVKNGAGPVSGSVILLDRKQSDFGTKASGSTWQMSLTLTIS